MKKQLLVLFIILVSVSIASAHNTESTVRFEDQNLQKHTILAYNGNGSFIGEFLSNGTLFFNTSQGLVLHIIPRRIDLLTTSGDIPGTILSYFPTMLFIAVMFMAVAFITILVLVVIVGLLTGKLQFSG